MEDGSRAESSPSGEEQGSSAHLYVSANGAGNVAAWRAAVRVGARWQQ